MDFLIHHGGEIGPYTKSEVRSRLTAGAIRLTISPHMGAPPIAGRGVGAQIEGVRAIAPSALR
jgi:hypothetical protein